MINRNEYNNFFLCFNNFTFSCRSLRFLSLCIYFFTFYFLLFISVPAQVVYEENDNEVYNFLERISQRGVNDFESFIRPLPRNYIAEKLEELYNNKNKLTSLELEELNYFRKDYGIELSLFNNISVPEPRTSFFEFDRYDRFRPFSFESENFSIAASPILGFEYGSNNKNNQTHLWNGIQFYGYIGKNIGFEFSFRDNSESGDSLNRTKYFTPETGVTIAQSTANSFEYSDFVGAISYSWDWGNISIAKQQITLGHEKSGNIILSDKAPSFPLIRLDIKPIEWLSFNYFHGWLNSDILDTNSFYPAFIDGHSREIQRKKFIASHTLTLTPIRGLDFSLGESVIYSDEIQIAYLFPMMFFRAADHYLHYPSNDLGDNSQFFFEISSKNHIKNTHLYASLYIDEIRPSDIFNSEKQRNQIGYNIGFSITEIPIDNLTFEIEYTHINPFAYVHYIPTLTYQNDSYNLGHWMGHNGDLIYAGLQYRIVRGLRTKFWVQSIRKGEEGTPLQQWDTKVPQPEFLFGLNTNYTYYGIDLNYEFIHDLHIRAKYQYSSVKTEYEEGKFNDESFNTFKFALYYGL